MSADNGIYIGRFKRVESSRPLVNERGAFYDVETGEYEYRVIHAQAIENCDYNSGYDSDIPKEVIDAYRVMYYSPSPVFSTSEAAYQDAQRLSEKELPILEYGISMIPYDVPFPYLTDEEAEIVITEYRNKTEAEAKKEREKEVEVKCLVTKGMFPHEYFVMVQDHPSLTSVVWRGWVDKHLVRVYYGSGVTEEGYHFGVVHAHKVKEEVREVGYNTTALQYLIEFPDGIPSHSVWVEPRLMGDTW